jgi:predicted SAM-dependent methyltransferase
MRRLEIGGGPSPAHPDWEQLDLNEWASRGNPTTHQYDMRLTPFAPDTFDEVYACNVLEHVRETQQTLAEWARILKPGGRLTVIVPDALGIIADYQSGKNTWGECSERLCGAQSYFQDVHRAAFTLNEMRPVIENAGLTIMELRSSHEGGGVYVEATKHGESKSGTQAHGAD